VYLYFRYLVAVFYRLELNLGRCIVGYPDVLPLNIILSESFTRHDLPAFLALSGLQTSMHSVVAPRELFC
jgi:hypothetical protein